MSGFVVILIVIAVIGLIGGVVFFAFRAVRNDESSSFDPVMARLAEATQRGENVSLEDIELEQPFSERVLIPLLKKIGEISSRTTPQKLIEETTKKLELAGNPGRIDAATFLSTRFIGAGLFGGVIFILSLIAVPPWPLGKTFLYLVIASSIGFFFPQLWLQSKIQRRQEEVRKAMPDALDLLTICVEAGLGFDAAMSKVAEKWENELSFMFKRCIREVQLGKPQREALKDMADRLGLAEMTSFIAAVIQSQILGVSLAKVLRIQSEQMRIKRRQRAEEAAHKAPVKMIVPMAFLTFPSIFIVLLAPAGFQIADAFGR